jgi:hypothetical protein
VALRGGSSKQSSLFRQLAEGLPRLLCHRIRIHPVRSRQIQRRLTVEWIEQLVREYEAGDDMTALAARWGIHRTTVAGHLARVGVVLRRQGVQGNRPREAARLYGKGWSCQRLAEGYGCHSETVRQALTRAPRTAPAVRPGRPGSQARSLNGSCRFNKRSRPTRLSRVSARPSQDWRRALVIAFGGVRSPVNKRLLDHGIVTRRDFGFCSNSEWIPIKRRG